MTGPYLVLADIHGNLPALKAVLADAAGRASGIWVLGDIAGYGPEPGACLALLRRWNATIVPGNHDWAVCGKLDTDSFNPEARQAVEIHRRILSDEDKSFLAGLPESRRIGSVSLSHGDPRNPIWGYVLTASAAAGVLAGAETSLTLVGHSHLPVLWAYDGNAGAREVPVPREGIVSYAGVPHLANPGSVGQSRDGDASARYLIVDPRRKTLEFRHCAWRGGSVRRKMKAGGYPPGLIERMVPPGR